MDGKNENKEVLSLDDLEKSWNDSKSLLKSILDDEENSETLSKAKEEKKEKKEPEKEEESEEGDLFDEEDEDDEEEEEDVKKSLDDSMSEDEEASAAMDVEPFLKKFVKAVSSRLDSIQKAYEKNVSNQKALAKALVAMGDQNMSIASLVEDIANTPVGSRSVIRKSMQKFENKPDENDLLKSMSQDDILEKAIKLVKSGEFVSMDVTKIQNRLNKGLPLEERHVKMLTAKKEDK